VGAAGQELQRLVEHFAATAAQADALRPAFEHALQASRAHPLLVAVRAPRRQRHVRAATRPLRARRCVFAAATI